jgi:hypothetical protein
MTVFCADVPVHGHYAIILLGLFASFFQSRTVAMRQHHKALYELHFVGKVFEVFGFTTELVEFRRPDIEVAEFDL